MIRLVILLTCGAALCVTAGCFTPRVPGAGLPTLPVPAGGADLNALLLYAVGVSFLGIAASVAALVWLPTKKLALAGLAGFGAMLACALGVKVAQPYLGYVVLGSFVLLLAGAVYVIRKYHMTALAAVGFGRDMSNAITDEDARAVKRLHAATQEDAGVRKVMDKLIAKVDETRAA